jgi:hypothetical protein
MTPEDLLDFKGNIIVYNTTNKEMREKERKSISIRETYLPIERTTKLIKASIYQGKFQELMALQFSVLCHKCSLFDD